MAYCAELNISYTHVSLIEKHLQTQTPCWHVFINGLLWLVYTETGKTFLFCFFNFFSFFFFFSKHANAVKSMIVPNDKCWRV